MDIKLVIKALQLDDEEWEEHLDLINRLRILTDAEQSQLFSALEPQKKAGKKTAGGGGRRSAHGESLKQQISNRNQSVVRPPATTDNDDDGNSPRCQAPRGDGRVCMLLADHNIHHLTTAMDYHEFVPPTEQAAVASGD